MKSKTLIFNLIFIIGTFIIANAQKQITPGEYQTQLPGSSEKIYLQVDENQNFQLIYLKGKFIYQDNKFKIELNNIEKPLFQVKKLNESHKSSELKIKFSSYALSYLYYLYFKTDIQDEYQPVSSIVKYDENYTNAELTLPKPTTLYILYYTENLTSDEAQIVIPNDVNVIELIMNYTLFDSFSKLEITQDPLNSDQITITDGISPLTLFLNPPKEKKEELIDELPVTISKNKDFKIENTEIEDYPAVEVAADDSYTPNGFKFQTFANLEEAINGIQTNNKFLVVSYSKNNSDFEQQYFELLKQQENYFQYYTEDDLKSYQKFEHYLLKKNEETLLKKNKIKSDNAVLVLNKHGEVLYSSENDFLEESENFSIYSSINDALIKAQAEYDIDKVFEDKKRNVNAIMEPLFKLAALPVDEYASETDNIEAVDDVHSGKYYQFKTTESQINTSWNDILSQNLKNETLNSQLAQVIKFELSNNGFTKKLFNKNILTLRACDRLSIDYLIKFKEAISVRDNDAYINYEENYNWTGANAVVNNYFYYLSGVLSDDENKQTVADYLQALLADTNYDYDLTNSYINMLENNESMKKMNYMSVYNQFFNINFNINKGIIEQLDELYSKTYSPETGMDWTAFKYNFSNMANSAAWYVVTESNAKNYLPQAIKWSEASNLINKDNGYFLDTLAQLYYQNGQKELAIKTQEKALKNIRENDDPGTYREIKDVLMKMKSGSY